MLNARILLASSLPARLPLDGPALEIQKHRPKEKHSNSKRRSRNKKGRRRRNAVVVLGFVVSLSSRQIIFSIFLLISFLKSTSLGAKRASVQAFERTEMTTRV